ASPNTTSSSAVSSFLGRNNSKRAMHSRVVGRFTPILPGSPSHPDRDSPLLMPRVYSYWVRDFVDQVSSWRSGVPANYLGWIVPGRPLTLQRSICQEQN